MAPGFDFALSFFLRCLYENESGNPESPDIGFLKGPLLVRVSNFTNLFAMYTLTFLRHIVSFLHLHHLLGMRMTPRK